jgi:cytochrome c553
MRMNRPRFAIAFAALALAAIGAHAQPADALQARSMAASCANCHGTNGNAQAGMIPLAGMPGAEIVRKMQDFKSGRQTATIMHQLAKGYSDEQIAALAAYFSSQKK